MLNPKFIDHFLTSCDPLDARQFLIAVKRLADDLSYGTDSSPFLGSGIEYVQSRQYEIGDPVKSIDWRVTARTGKYHIKEYEAPKRMPVYILIDTSASMTVSSQTLSKYAWALQIAGGLAFASLDRVSPVGVVGVGGRDFRVKPSLSRDQIMQWLYRLRTYRFDEPTSLTQRMAEFTPSLNNTSMIIVISDLHDPGALNALKLAGQRHDVIALQMQDPVEQGIKGTGFFRGHEAESGRQFVSRGKKNWLDQDGLETELKRAGIDHLLIRTDREISGPLRQFFSSRNLLGRGAR